jgi:hypothetical protein
MSIRLSVRMEQLGSHWTDFPQIWYFNSVSKICLENFKVCENPTGITSALHEDLRTFTIYPRLFLRMRNVSEESCRENQNHILCYIPPPPPKIVPLWHIVEKICRAGQAADDNMAHAHCMLGIEDYRYILRICNIYCFSKATVVTRTREMIRLYVHCMSIKCLIHWRCQLVILYNVGER